MTSQTLLTHNHKIKTNFLFFFIFSDAASSFRMNEEDENNQRQPTYDHMKNEMFPSNGRKA